MTEPRFHIVGHNLCPYVQRVVIVLDELQLPYERTDIDLNAKPDWLKPLSPTGKVPVLIVDGKTALFESQVIVEYLNDISSANLFSADPLARARERSWIAYGEQMLAVVAEVIYRAETTDQLTDALGRLAAMLDVLETQVQGSPFFRGPSFGMIDAVYATVFRFLPLLADLGLPSGKHDRLAEWQGALWNRPSVSRAVSAEFDSLLREFVAEKPSHAGRSLRSTPAVKRGAA